MGGRQTAAGTIAFAEVSRLGYLIRDGVYVTLLARNRAELIAAAEALTPIE